MTLSLKAQTRTIFNKALESVRKKGDLPAVLYGPKEDNQVLTVDLVSFQKVFNEAGESSVITLETESGKKDVLVKNVDYHPVTGEPIHVDFYAIEKGKAVEVSVPLNFIGEAPAVKNMGGTLVKVIHELDIEAMPKDLPHEIEVDISTLVDFDSKILAQDIKLPSGVICTLDKEEVIALVNPEEDNQEDEQVDISAIEVEKKGKKEEESEE